MNPATQRQDSDMQSIKQQLRDTWCAGNYGEIAKTLAPSARELLGRHPVIEGASVLDVACGTGQVAIPAAQSGARVTGIDIADNLILQAQTRADEQGLPIRFDVGDAESLPYDDNSFDQVYSVIGAMFAPRPDRVASELKRVCKPGGRIVMANWTPQGFVGRFFATVARHVPPPPELPSPLLWGEETHVRERFGDDVAALTVEETLFEFRYPFEPARVVEVYREYFGPVRRACAQLDDQGRAALLRDLEELWATHNLATDGTTHTRAQVLEVVVVPA